MRELDRALVDIAVMRDQIARSCEFQGFGPTTLAITATLAFMVAALQPYVLHDPVNHASLFVTVWFCVAGFSLLIDRQRGPAPRQAGAWQHGSFDAQGRR